MATFGYHNVMPSEVLLGSWMVNTNTSSLEHRAVTSLWAILLAATGAACGDAETEELEFADDSGQVRLVDAAP